MWRIITNCSRFLKQKTNSDKIGQLTQIASPPQTATKTSADNSNASSDECITFKIDDNLKATSSRATVNSSSNKLNYYKFDYYDYLCTILGINSLFKFGYKDKVKIPNFKMSNVKGAGSEESTSPSAESVKAPAGLAETPVVESSLANDRLDSLFNEFNTLNEQTMGKLENMIALNKLKKCKYDEAIPYLRIASEKGYAKASYNLGLCYQDGLGVVRDEKMAFYYFKLAAENAHSEAAYNCAMYYLKYNQDIQMTIKYLRIAVNNCKNDGQMDCAKKILAVLLINQQESFSEAFTLLNNISNMDSECEYYLGLCYENGYGIDVDWLKALDFYIKSSKSGYTKAKGKFIELRAKQIHENDSKREPTRSLLSKKLGHFTHSIGKFETDKTNCDQIKSFWNNKNQQQPTLRSSHSSSQLGLLLLRNEQELKIMKNDHNNLIHVH